MLVLSRKLNETVVIDGGIRITVVGIRGNQLRLGIEAPDHIGIYRGELCLPRSAVQACAGPLMPAPQGIDS
jgi:carbon storage regulator